jgi:hypothetical protein
VNKNDGEEPLKLIDEENKDISDIGGNKEKNNKNSSYINIYIMCLHKRFRKCY